jgi:acetoin utilization deacetylase AcuC-like enzyme
MMAYHEIIVPAARRFNPDIMLVSMGYDAHVNDPFELLQYRDITYHTLAASLKQLAAELCHGRLVFTLEGGYNPESLGKAVVATWLALIGQPLPTDVAAGDINVRPEPDLEQVEGMLLDLKRVLEL